MSGPVHIPDAVIEAALERWFEHLCPDWQVGILDKDRRAMREIITDAFDAICDANAAVWERE
jgi:hypothetical protein